MAAEITDRVTEKNDFLNHVIFIKGLIKTLFCVYSNLRIEIYIKQKIMSIFNHRPEMNYI
jgi:hypothetical protein